RRHVIELQPPADAAGGAGRRRRMEGDSPAPDGGRHDGMRSMSALIAFEGLDQSGKETQSRLLRARLEAKGHRVETLTFPDDGTPLGKDIRAALAGARDHAP